MLYPNSRIMIFAKAPIAGQVKTRLIPDFGESFATELHCAMLWQCLTVISQANICPVELWCTPNEKHPFFESCVKSFGVRLRVQKGENLGAKLSNAFKHVLSEVDSAVVVGADCPTLIDSDFIAAFDSLLAGKDVVINPAEDGGYVLLGKSKLTSTLFEQIDWGSSAVFKQTTDKLQSENLKWTQLAVRRDIDLASDVEYLASKSNQLNLHAGLQALLKQI